MNVPTIEMEPETARVKAIEYGDVRASDPELETARRAYERLADRGTLIDLRVALRAGGVDEEGMPRLAVARADRRFVTYRGPAEDAWSRHPAQFDATALGANFTTPTLCLSFGELFDPPSRKLAWLRFGTGSRTCHGVTLIPMVPPSVEKRRSILRHRFVLWEVEGWADPKSFSHPMPPGDPYLLEHLKGDLYSIVGEWDLTPLERAIVQGRELA